MMAHLGKKRQSAIEIIVREIEAGPPNLQAQEDQRGDEEILAQKDESTGLLIDSGSGFWRNHGGVLD
jgi:hypothetical protein